MTEPVHYLPELQNERTHVLAEDCWCSPRRGKGAYGVDAFWHIDTVKVFSCSPRVGDRIDTRKELDLLDLPEGSLIRNEKYGEYEHFLWGETCDWFQGGWPAVPVLPVTITRIGSEIGVGDRVSVRSSRIAGFPAGINVGTVFDVDAEGRFSVHIEHPSGNNYYMGLLGSELEVCDG